MVSICYDKFGRDIERLFVDTHGMPTFNNDGVAGVRKHYGCDGRLDMIENLGLEGEIVYDKNLLDEYFVYSGLFIKGVDEEA